MFRKMFGADSPVMEFLSRVTDLLLLNVLTLILCIPIFTIGAAVTALHNVCGRMARRDSYYTFKTYFKSFKENFLQATAEWLMVLALIGFLLFDVMILVNNDTNLPRMLLYLLIALIIVVFIFVQFLFPLQSRFINPVKKTIHNTIFMTLGNFPKAILMAMCWSLPFLLLEITTNAIPILVFFGLSVPIYLQALIYAPILEKFVPEDDITDDMDFKIDENDSAFDDLLEGKKEDESDD